MRIDAVVIVLEMITRVLGIVFVIYDLGLASYSWYVIEILFSTDREAIDDL